MPLRTQGESQIPSIYAIFRARSLVGVLSFVPFRYFVMFVFDTRVFGALFVRVDIVMISRGGKGWWNQCEFIATLFFL